MNDIENDFKCYSEFDMSSDCQKIGLFVSTNGLLEGEYQSTTYIRFLSTFNLINSKFEICIINVDDENEFRLVKEDLLNDYFSLDIIIIERIAFESNEFLELLIEKCKLLDISIIYEIDDDLMSIDKTHALYDFYHEKSLGIEYIARNSDVVVVSTNYLKKVFIDLNDNIVVIPNVITDYWDCHISKLKQDNSLKIGYVGTFSHNNDLKLIKNAISIVKNHFKSKNIEIIFELIGGTSEDLDWANRILFTLQDRPYPNFVKFLKKSIQWDVAVAPLTKSNINYSKSNLKYLEYTALGIPGVYSDIGPYKESIIHGYNGLLVKNNTSEEWAKNIISLIENEKLKKHIVKNASEDVLNNYSINIAVEMWENILNNCVRDKKTELYKLFINYKNNHEKCSFIEFISKNSYDIINKSKLFDSNWYLSQYGNVSGDLINHYLQNGVKKKYNPSKSFDTLNYLNTFSNFCSLGINPFVHHILYHDLINDDFTRFGKYDKKHFEETLEIFKFDGLSNKQVQGIFDCFSKKLSFIIPVFNHDCDIYRFLYYLIKNTHVDFQLYFFTDSLFKPNIELNLTYFKNLKYDIIEFSSFNEFYTKFINLISKVSSDLVILNPNLEPTPLWLNKLVYTAYLDEDIGFVSPMSNLLYSLSSESILDKFSLSFDNLNNNIKLNSENSILNMPYFDGSCIFIKQNVILKCNFNDYSFVFDDKDKIFAFKLNQNIYKHVLDLNNYIYVNEDFNFSLNGSPKNNFPLHLDIKRFLNSFELISLKSKLFNFHDFNKSFRNILYVSTEDNKHLIDDFLIKSIKSNYNCYFLTYSNNSIKIWDDNDVIYEYGNDKNNEKIKFNILNLLNINLVHVFDIDDFSYDFIKIVKKIKLPLYISCYKELKSTIFEELLSFSNRIFVDKTLTQSIDEKLSNKVSVVNYDILGKINQLKNASTDIIKIFVPGNIEINSQDLEIFNEVKKIDVNNKLEFHFLGNIPSFLNNIGINHGEFTEENFINILNFIKPAFIGIFNIFPEIFKIYERYSLFEIPLLTFDDEKIKCIVDDLKGVNIVSKNSAELIFKEIIAAYAWKNYYVLLKEIFHSKNNFQSKMLKISNEFEIQYNNFDVFTKFNHHNTDDLYSILFKFNSSLNRTCGSFIINNWDECFKSCFINQFPEQLLNGIILNEKPLISIIIPVHNNFNNLSISIDSIFNQSYKNIEVIFVDEYSTDGTQEILKDLCKDNIKAYFLKQNNGFYHACNFGLKHSSGEYVFYFDVDSEWDFRYIEIMVKIFSYIDIDVLYSGELIYNNRNSGPLFLKFNGNNFIDLRNCCHKNQINDLCELDNLNSLSVPISCINYYLNDESYGDFNNNFKNDLVESNAINIMLQWDCINQCDLKLSCYNKIVEILGINQELNVYNDSLNEKNSTLQKDIGNLKEQLRIIESENSILEHELDSYKYEIFDLKEDKFRLIGENKSFLNDISDLRNELINLEPKIQKIESIEKYKLRLIDENNDLSKKIIDLENELHIINSKYLDLKRKFNDKIS